jgi:hypothetical protein
MASIHLDQAMCLLAVVSSQAQHPCNVCFRDLLVPGDCKARLNLSPVELRERDGIGLVGAGATAKFLLFTGHARVTFRRGFRM